MVVKRKAAQDNMARHGSKPIYGRGQRRAAVARRRRALVRVAALAAATAAFLGLAYAAGRLLARPAREETPSAPRYTGTAPFTVAVDAGHGGKDNGAVGLAVEKELTAATAAELTALLEADPNFTPAATRADYDEAATPSQRAEAANQQGAQLLVSIHCNSDPTGTASGLECYPLPPASARHANSLFFAQSIAAEMQAAGQTLRGTQGIRYAYYSGNEKILVDAGGAESYDLPTFGILEKAACPAVLVEQCFVTCEADVAAFGTEEGCRTAARCYYRAICTYFDTQPME